MRNYFMRGSNIFVEFTPNSENKPHGYLALHKYILVLPVSYKVNKQATHVEIIDAKAEVFYKDKFIAEAKSERLFYIRNHDQNNWENFKINLDKFDLAAIEKLRNGSDVEFKLRIQGLGLTSAKDTNEKEYEKADTFDSVEVRFHIDQSHWLKLLDGWKYSENFLIEIHKPQSDRDLQSAFTYLKMLKNYFILASGKTR